MPRILDADVRSFEIEGRLDVSTAGELRTSIDQALAAGTVRLIVDLRETAFIDSGGLATLTRGMKECRLAGGDLRIAIGEHSPAARLFRLRCLDQVLVMAPTPEELLDGWDRI
ncbi:MAG: STAS domain-containing protein [Actinomycetota bacterium]